LVESVHLLVMTEEKAMDRVSSDDAKPSAGQTNYQYEIRIHREYSGVCIQSMVIVHREEVVWQSRGRSEKREKRDCVDRNGLRLKWMQESIEREKGE
jgi:hypothetical protein